ncbi:sugar ABC transporter ATP-binding protein [Agrococcus beijingensis]|uniref:sugar ABC transporter ATP-binding protein n=1 Tax=Agrococcus beijingensis TaxID=3068634 RepID=UPI002740C2BA|nr:sugar ABC transporter ATP-binding protein [Agrococcus sp. REN33]
MTIAHSPEPRAAVPAAPAPRLSVESLSMTFGAARVLRDVHIEVRPGEIHGLVGQNGSGKSTLAKVLTGLYRPDPGTVVSVDGQPLPLPIRPHQARGYGMSVVHQNLGLIPSMTVIENMRMGRLRAAGPFRRIDWARERAEATDAFERIGRLVPLDSRVSSLSEESRTAVAIARVLQDATPGEGLIIFDESTRALGRRALESFYRDLDEIVATGTSVLLITHRLEEVVDGADSVTVLRDGRIVESGRQVEGMTEQELTSLILGRDIIDLGERIAHARTDDAPRVRVEGLTGLRIRDLTLELQQGEVVGVTGLGGSAYDDVPYLLSGVAPATAGTIELPDQTIELSGLSPADAIAQGIAIVPEGREHSGLAMGMTVIENTAFPQTARTKRLLSVLPRAAERELAEQWIERLDVRPPRADAVVGTFSGGNAQKVFIAKWLATDPRLLLLHEPTQAVDVGARQTIVEAVREAAKDRFVLVAGGDENELALLCDRVLVFVDGRVDQELTGDLTPDRIVQAIYAGSARAKLRDRTLTGTLIMNTPELEAALAEEPSAPGEETR